MSEKKVAMISGMATGIGRASALRLAQEGFLLMLCDWNQLEGERTTELCKEKGVDAVFLKTDMGDEEDVKRAVKTAIDNFGQIDVYFCNQGTAHMPMDFQDIPMEEVEKVIHTNFKSAFLGLKYVGACMIPQKSGSIIVTGSSSGLQPEWGYAAYGATKAAIVSMVKSAAVEYARYGIRVNCISPGCIETPLCAALVDYANRTGYQQHRISMPLLHPQRMGRPEEIASLVAYLASSESAYMTGTVIPVDSGNTL